MKPIKLCFDGIYSYQKQINIDFEKLTQDGLFGIFGKVGSGKSSILEAISYVLYGKLERLSQGDRLTYNLMNLQSDSFFIEFDFVIDQPYNAKYRFRVEARRNRRQFQEIYTPARNQYIWNNAKKDWEPKSLSAEEVLGLSYDNFRRTIIIPQGQFQDFLGLGGKARSAMMRELFNLHHYHLLPKLSPLRKRNNEQILAHETQLEFVAHASPQALDDCQQNLGEILKAIRQQSESLKTTQNAINAQAQAKSIYEELEKVSQKLANVESQAPDWEARAQKLKAYQLCKGRFEDLIEAFEKHQQQVTNLKETIEGAEKRIEQKKKEAQQLRQEVANLKEAYESRETLLQEAKELELLVKLRQQSQINQEFAQRLAKGEEMILQNKAQITAVEQQRLDYQTEISAINAEMPNQEQVAKVEAWFKQRDNILADIQGTQQKIRKTQQTIQKDSEKLRLQAQQVLEEDIAPEVPAIAKQLEQALDHVQEEIQGLQQQINRLETQSELQQFAQHLHENPNEACPLCGSLEHPNIMSLADVESQIAAQKTAQESRRETQKSLHHFKEEVIAQQSRQKLMQSQITADQKHLEHEQRELEKHEATFIWKDFDPEDAGEVQKLQAKIKRLQKKIQEKEIEVEKLIKTSQKLLEAREKYQAAKAKIEQDYAVGKSQQQQLEQQIQSITPENYQDYSNTDLEKEQNALRQKHQQLSQNYERQVKAQQTAENEVKSQEAALQVYQQNQQEAKKQLHNTQKALEKRLEEASFDDLETVRGILQQEIPIEQEQTAIQAFMQERHNLKQQKAQIEQRKQGQIYDEKAYTELKTRAEQQEAALKAQQRQQTEQEVAIKSLEKDLITKQKLEQKLKTLRQREENIKTLDSLFRGEGFVQYISAIYLRQICHIANQRFQKLTSNRLELEVNEKYHFEVRDILNGGQNRSVKTLSGGQTFQAALSLALALADSIQIASRSSHNFFFLDEGFGSQDDESLRIVFQTLQNLKAENRVVGVISHVESLQREISVFLNIENDEKEGSNIKESWRMT